MSKENKQSLVTAKSKLKSSKELSVGHLASTHGLGPKGIVQSLSSQALSLAACTAHLMGSGLLHATPVAAAAAACAHPTIPASPKCWSLLRNWASPSPIASSCLFSLETWGVH